MRLGLLSEAVGGFARFSLLSGTLLVDINARVVVTANLGESLANEARVLSLLSLLQFSISMVPVESLVQLLELVLRLDGIEGLTFALGADDAIAARTGTGAVDLEALGRKTPVTTVVVATGLTVTAEFLCNFNGAGDNSQ